MNKPTDVPAIGPSSRLARSADALAQEIDGETVIMDLASESYFGLNETGTFVWERLDGEASVADIAAGMAEVYAAPEEDLLRDCVELLELLLAEGLVQASPGAAPA